MASQIMIHQGPQQHTTAVAATMSLEVYRYPPVLPISKTEDTEDFYRRRHLHQPPHVRQRPRRIHNLRGHLCPVLKEVRPIRRLLRAMQ